MELTVRDVLRECEKPDTKVCIMRKGDVIVIHYKRILWEMPWYWELMDLKVNYRRYNSEGELIIDVL